jgi:hypothetical protein
MDRRSSDRGTPSRPLGACATLSAVAAAQIRSANSSSRTDHPSVIQNLHLGRPVVDGFAALVTSALVTRALRNDPTVSAFGARRTPGVRLKSESVQRVPLGEQPLTQAAQMSRSISAWTPAPIDRAGP